jgi:glycosyltransferase involved in cell wall biosynthesis
VKEVIIATGANRLTVSGADPAGTAPARTIRVLHLIHSVTHGGIESELINWVLNFDRNLFEVHVACFAFDRNREEAFLRATKLAGIPVLLVPWSRYKPFVRAARAVAKIVRELNIDVIHTHGYYGDALGAFTKLFVRVKVVSTVFVWGKYEFHRQLMQIMDWVALRFVDKVTAHCEHTRDLTVRLGFRAEKISTLIAGFPAGNRPELTAEERLELRRAAGVRDDEFLMVNVARIHPEKAHDQLIRSFKIVHDRYPNTKLWISGTGWQWLENQYKELRAQLDLEGAVEFVGFRQNLWPMLGSADIMVHASHVEGVAIAILYGMAAGLPIVASDVGGLYEVLHQGETGLRVPENDIMGFANAMVSLIEKPEFARRLGAAARRFVETDYSIETAVRRVEGAYQEVLGMGVARS